MEYFNYDYINYETAINTTNLFNSDFKCNSNIRYSIKKEIKELLSRFDEMKTQVSVDGKLFPLTEISNIIGALSKARFNIPDISVYVPKDEMSKFNKFKLESYLDLPEIDREKFHGIHYDQIKLF